MEEGIDRLARAIAAESNQPVYLYRFSFASNIPLIWDNFRYIGPPPSKFAGRFIINIITFILLNHFSQF